MVEIHGMFSKQVFDCESFLKYRLRLLFIIFSIFISSEVEAQQYNSDNYVVMPHGVATSILTVGERNSCLSLSLALVPKFEFAFSSNMFWDDKKVNAPQHFTTTAYAKYSVWVNNKNNGGLAALLGMGRSPSYYGKTQFVEFHKNYWTAIAATFPLFNNKLSLDLYPGALLDIGYGEKKELAWGFTYSTRLTINEIIPKFFLVGELYGTAGKAYSQPEYKVGVQWTPNSFIIPSISFGSQLNGNQGAGFEFGVVIYSPPFLKKQYLRNNTIAY